MTYALMRGIDVRRVVERDVLRRTGLTMKALPSAAPSQSANLHALIDRAIAAFRRALPGRRIHHVMDGEGRAVRDADGVLTATAILLAVVAAESECDIFVATHGSAHHALSIKTRVTDAQAERSPLLIDLQVARKLIERSGGTLDTFDIGDTRTMLASLPRVGRVR